MLRKNNCYVFYTIILTLAFFSSDNLSYASETVLSFITTHKTINIDGNFEDWDIGDRIYNDIDGPDCNNSPGQDIREIYVTQDDNFIYLRYVLNGLPDDTFGYKFGEELHVYVGQSNGQDYISFATPSDISYELPDIPDSYVKFNDNQFECKFSKNDVLAWKNKNLSAWCDQGFDTVCRDHVSLMQAIGWMYVQHRDYENGNSLNRMNFGLQYADGQYLENLNSVTSVKLFDKDENPVNLTDLNFWSEDTMGGYYDANAGKWYFNDNFVFESGISSKVENALVNGLYRIEVTLTNGYTYLYTYNFNELVNLPIISSETFNIIPHLSNGILWAWGISDALLSISSNYNTSVRAIINVYNNEQYFGSVSVKVPSHLGRLYITDTIIQKIHNKGNKFGLVIQLRTNDNNNRSYSDEIITNSLDTAILSNILCDIDNDGKTGLSEAIHALKIVSDSK